MVAVNPEAQERNRAVWEAGDWDQVADYVRGVGPALLDAVGIEPGMDLLDVGAGSGGSVAVPAAKRGVNVTASDISSLHFEAGRRRADAEGVEIEWVEADAQELPFDDGAFDRVTSTFGHMFAPDHALAAAEIVRVCKPGGIIGFCAWTLEGAVGAMFRLTASYMPPPPAGFQPPPLWGDPDHVRGLLDPLGVEVSFERCVNVFEHESVDGYHEHFVRNFGPMVTAKAVLGDEKFAALEVEFDEQLASENQATDGTLRLEGEYLRTIARKP